MKLRMLKDNVLVRLDPLGDELSTELIKAVQLKPAAQQTRWGTVIASGPGYHRPVRVKRADPTATLGEYTYDTDNLVPNVTQPGDRVLIDHLAGFAWDGEISVPRHNVGKTTFDALYNYTGEFRIVREEEISCIVGQVEAAE